MTDRYRSQLERRVATLLDGLNIDYEYEQLTLTTNGLTYLPDFVLTGRDQIIEPKGWMDKDSRAKIEMAARIHGFEVIVIGDGPGGLITVPPDHDLIEVEGWDFVQCTECGEYNFVPRLYDWHCRVCGGETDRSCTDLFRQYRFRNMFNSIDQVETALTELED